MGIFEDIIDDDLPDPKMRGVTEENLDAGGVHMMTQEEEQGLAAERAAEKAKIAALLKEVDALDAEDEELLDLYLEMVSAGEGWLVALAQVEQGERMATALATALATVGASDAAPGQKRQREEPSALALSSEDLLKLYRMLDHPPALRVHPANGTPLCHRNDHPRYQGVNIVLGPNILQPRFVIFQGGRPVVGDTHVSMMILLVRWPEEHGEYLRNNPTEMMTYAFQVVWIQDPQWEAAQNIVGVSRQGQNDLTCPATFNLCATNTAYEHTPSTGPIPVRLHEKALSRNIGGNGTKLAFLVIPELPVERIRHPCLAWLGQPFVSVLRVG